MSTNGLSIKPLKVKLLAGEQKATEKRHLCGVLGRVVSSWRDQILVTCFLREGMSVTSPPLEHLPAPKSRPLGVKPFSGSCSENETWNDPKKNPADWWCSFIRESQDVCIAPAAVSLQH